MMHSNPIHELRYKALESVLKQLKCPESAWAKPNNEDEEEDEDKGEEEDGTWKSSYNPRELEEKYDLLQKIRKGEWIQVY